MGVLVDVTSQPSFVLEREGFPKAHRALIKLAKTQPSEFEDADAVVRTKTLADALSAAYWSARFDAYGDLVGLSYQVDKAPRDSSDLWPLALLDLLAAAGARGELHYSADEYACVFELDAGVYRSEVPSLLLRGPLRASPGGEVELSLVATQSLDEVPLRVELRSDWVYSSEATWGLMPGVEPRFETGSLHAHESRAIRFTLPEDARGIMSATAIVGSHRAIHELAIDPGPEELAQPFVVIDRRTEPHRTIVPKGAQARTLESLRRYARRHAGEPGGEFLAAVADAESLSDALAHVGFELRSVARKCELACVVDRLPGAEIHVIALLDRLAKPSGRCYASCLLAFEHSPTLWREYRVSRGHIVSQVRRRG